MIQIIDRYEIRDGIPQIVLYIYTPLEYEFGAELTNFKANVSNTVFKIRDYLQRKFSNYSKDSTFMLIVDGVILGSATLEKLLNSN